MKTKLPPRRRKNFLPQSLRPSFLSPQLLKAMMLAVVVGVPVLGFGSHSLRWFAERHLRVVTQEQEAMNSRITAGIQSRDSTADQLAVSAVQKALSEKLYWADVFKELSNVAPKSVWLSTFDTSVESGIKKVVISGHGSSQAEIAEFFARLERSYFFRDVQLKFTETSEVSGSAPYRFQFEGKVFDDKKGGQNGPT